LCIRALFLDDGETLVLKSRALHLK
jgi:hypothetical protein